MHRGHGHPGPSGRRHRTGVPGDWQVRARVERFVEPALLLCLREGSSHGYELADRLNEVAGIEVDYGNLYRLLRKLEQAGLVESHWNDELPGRSKRTYDLTDSGSEVLDAWADALRAMQERTAALLSRYDERIQ